MLTRQESDLARLHNDAIKSDPFISAALGPNAKIERMKAGHHSDSSSLLEALPLPHSFVRSRLDVPAATMATELCTMHSRASRCHAQSGPANPRDNASALKMRLQAASLRLGSQGLKTSFDDHLLIIGDAAGHIDPLTGEGIHTAIMAR